SGSSSSGSTSTSTTEGSASEGSGSSSGSTTAATTATTATDGTTEGTTEGTTGTTASTGAETDGASCNDDGECGAGEYCDWTANSCGNSGEDVGTCKPSPEGCDAEYAPVCGCDGEVHSNECVANGAGTDVSAAGGCEPPAEYYPCGYAFCDTATQYCEISTNDVVGEPDYYSCRALPEACLKEPVCGCLAGEPCFEFECTEEGGLTIICPGG
ncbi:MAG TPA: hypothetical protein ENK31_09775, partial [Nannocystis exedens]|nr:hypothetical protein [Nannocystis exedens]